MRGCVPPTVVCPRCCRLQLVEETGVAAPVLNTPTPTPHGRGIHKLDERVLLNLGKAFGLMVHRLLKQRFFLHTMRRSVTGQWMH